MSPSFVQAQVVINEISPASDPEWVELYNTSDSEESLSGCILYFDDNHDTQFINFSEYELDVLGTGLFFVIQKGQYNWSSNWLNNSGDELNLACGEDSDTFIYDDSDSEKTWGRYPDGGNISNYEMEPSRGLANTSPATPTPTPTSSPTSTSSPTPTPTSSSTPTPVATKSPTPSPTSTSTTKPKSDDDSQAESEVLGLRDELKTPEPTESPESVESSSKSPLLAGLFIFGGLVLIGAAGFPFAKNRWLEYKKSKYNGEHEEKT